MVRIPSHVDTMDALPCSVQCSLIHLRHIYGGLGCLENKTSALYL